jgi:hypothetical protein
MKITKTVKSKTRKTIAPKAAQRAVVTPAAKKTAPKRKTAKTAKTGPSVPALEITSDQIARRAYFIWEQQGRPAGREREHWILAESQLKAEQSFAE